LPRKICPSQNDRKSTSQNLCAEVLARSDQIYCRLSSLCNVCAPFLTAAIQRIDDVGGACFNNTYKITAPVFDVWMRLLHATEGSVLWLLRDSDGIEANLRKEAAARGIDPARLVLPSSQRIGDSGGQSRKHCTVEIDSNAYSVPWRLIGDSVLVTVTDTAVRIRHAGREVAVHATLSGHRQRAIDPAQYAGVAGANGRYAATPPLPSVPATAPASLVRDLGEYEALLGGGF
jgi:Glycosyl transferase family 41